MTKVTLFSQIIRHLPKEKMRAVIRECKSDFASKGYDTWTQFIAMIFCHIGQCNSVRDISNVLRSATGNLAHLGIKNAPSKSSVSYQNKHRDWEVFQKLFYALLDTLGPRFRVGHYPKIRLKRKIFALDSTLISLCLELFDWAHYRKAKGAVKLHTVLDYDGLLPVFVDMTDGKTHDVQVAKTIEFPKGSVLLMDRAYLDFAWLGVLDSSGVFFVTRMKTNIRYEVGQDYDTQGNPEKILSDQDIALLGQQSAKKYPGTLRLVTVQDTESDKVVEFLTNNLTWKAETIAELYRQRWQIEVFFKQIKQHLKIKSFIGTTPNAVLIQVWTAMSTIVLLKYLKELAKYGWNLSNLTAFIRLNLFVKINLQQWLDKPFRARGSPTTGQLNLFGQ